MSSWSSCVHLQLRGQAFARACTASDPPWWASAAPGCTCGTSTPPTATSTTSTGPTHAATATTATSGSTC